MDPVRAQPSLGEGKITFTNAGDIWVIDSDGTNHVNLTDNQGSDLVPKWLPDGARIIFGSRREGALNVYVMNADGTDLVNITSDPLRGQLPDWFEPAGCAVPSTAVDVRSLGLIKQLMR